MIARSKLSLCLSKSVSGDRSQGFEKTGWREEDASDGPKVKPKSVLSRGERTFSFPFVPLFVLGCFLLPYSVFFDETGGLSGPREEKDFGRGLLLIFELCSGLGTELKFEFWVDGL